MHKSIESTESTCSGAQRKRNGFSLRRLLSASQLIGHRPNNNNPNNNGGARNDSVKSKPASIKFEPAPNPVANEGRECPLCLNEVTGPEELHELAGCGHRSCYSCLQQYLRIEILESRVGIACPECTEAMHPNEIRDIIKDVSLYEKYEDFMVRRVLASEPDARWCPAPDCGFAVIAAGCASCPKIRCERPGCNSHFCYHCKAEWHPNQTCDAARAQRSPGVTGRSSSVSFVATADGVQRDRDQRDQQQTRDDIKPCPRCQVLIVKMDDGSCNHMICAVCGAEFCWLCMKVISDLHYLSPSGCTFWGKKPWSRKKKILWQLGTLVGAPVGIALLAGIAVPAMIIGIPVWVGRKLYTRYRKANKHKRNAAIIGGAVASVVVSPVLAGLAVGIGVPILLFYVYGVVPVSLCRSGGCGVSTTSGGVRFDFDDENDFPTHHRGAVGSALDSASMDAASHRGADPSIGEASLSMVSGSQVLRLGHDVDLDSASNVAVAGTSLTGSIASGSVMHRLEIRADVQRPPDDEDGDRTSMGSHALRTDSVCLDITSMPDASVLEPAQGRRVLATEILRNIFFRFTPVEDGRTVSPS